MWHRHFIQVLLPITATLISRPVSPRYDRAKKSEVEGVGKATLSSPNNYMQRAGIHKLHAPHCFAKSNLRDLRSDLSVRSLMSGRWATVYQSSLSL
jgi:Domain of unknown function (DUF6429)